MTVTQFNDELVSLINKAELPFDAKVFVVRSIHNEVESKYNEYLNVVRNAQEQEKAQQVKSEQENK